MVRIASACLLAVTVGSIVRLLRKRLQQNRHGCYVLLGTYTEANVGTPPNIQVDSDERNLGKGIHACWLDLNSGKLQKLSAHSTGYPNPSFLAKHPTQQVIYAVSETASSGHVCGVKIREHSGTLQFENLGAVNSFGGLPCHLMVDRAGSTLLCSNYLDGRTAVLPIHRDGSLSSGWYLQNEGSCVNKLRQEGPHAHSAVLDATESLLYSTDLGANRIFVHEWPLKEGEQSTPLHQYNTFRPGSGPRHIVFHPSGTTAYVICELTGTLHLLDVKTLTELAKYDVLPDNAPNLSADGTRAWAADIVLCASGRFLYASARKHDVIACFEVLDRGRKLNRIAVEHVGKSPRSIAVTGDSRFLVAAYQHSDAVETFQIHPETGRLKRTGFQIAVPKPVSVLLWC
eukprot:TRINITY_DN109396_c0_g1_i1.p1 TRINITY_DN109396_c0_g1~~TRINITY_DN109396_c0_g1_i1.p1  ORF type:complete len:400 (+),score=37.92 TRINITY_DN109396_c0_g1_i1:105-1304(+)